MEIFRKINKILAFPLVIFIWIYQKSLSPDHGLLKFLYPYGYCKFYPSCSEYSRQTLLKYGLTGIPKAIRRIVACTPSSLGGIDLP